MFNPKFTITPKIASLLLKIEAIKHEINTLPLTITLLASLRESARISTTHYSTMIEGKRLTKEEVLLLLKNKNSFPKYGLNSQCN